MSTHPLAAAIARYRRILSLPGARSFAASAAVARQGVAMYGIAVVFAVRGGGGSFTVAGLATAAFAIAEAVGGPRFARAMDGRGQRRILLLIVPVHVAAVGGLVATITLHGPVVVVVSTATVAGAFAPQPGALSAARWAHVVPDRDALTTALSLEAAVNDLVFLIGPSLVALLNVVLAPAAGLVVAGALVAAGGTGLVRQRRTEPPPHPRTPGPDGPRLWSSSFARLLAVNLAMGVFFGAAPIGVTAAATAFGRTAVAGPILTAAGVASLATGLVVGGRSRGGGAATALRVAAFVLTVAGAAVGLAPGPVTLALGYLVAGGSVAAVLIPSAVLLQRSVPGAVYTQAVTWTNSASAAGIALSAPLAGVVVDGAGWRAMFPLAVAGVAVVPVLIRQHRTDVGDRV